MYKVITTYRNGIKIVSVFDTLKEANSKATELFFEDIKKNIPEFISVSVDEMDG